MAVVSTEIRLKMIKEKMVLLMQIAMSITSLILVFLKSYLITVHITLMENRQRVTSEHKALLYLTRLVVGFPPRRPRSGHMGFVVDEEALKLVFSWYIDFPCHLYHRLVHLIIVHHPGL
jgi:hypothetical protein